MGVFCRQAKKHVQHAPANCKPAEWGHHNHLVSNKASHLHIPASTQPHLTQRSEANCSWHGAACPAQPAGEPTWGAPAARGRPRKSAYRLMGWCAAPPRPPPAAAVGRHLAVRRRRLPRLLRLLWRPARRHAVPAAPAASSAWAQGSPHPLGTPAAAPQPHPGPAAPPSQTAAAAGSTRAAARCRCRGRCRCRCLEARAASGCGCRQSSCPTRLQGGREGGKHVVHNEHDELRWGSDWCWGQGRGPALKQRVSRPSCGLRLFHKTLRGCDRPKLDYTAPLTGASRVEH